MADVRPLPGLRYTATADLAALVTPPYDVIAPEAQARYYERHADNIIRLELGRDLPGDDALDNRYTRAAVTFAEWRLRGVLAQDVPSFYLYEQRFAVAGTTYARGGLLARVRLEPWDAGVILPHERTLSKPKDDRLKLLRACAANLSPILALYDDPKGDVSRGLARARKGKPTLELVDDEGEEHRLWLVRDAALTARLASLFGGRQLYIADGHHRYETALAYRDEVLELRRELGPDDAANFVLMALCAVDDPGLVVLPTHRLVRVAAAERLAALDATLTPWFEAEALDTAVGADGWVARLAAAGAVGKHTAAMVLVRAAGATLLRLHSAGQAAMATMGGEAADGERRSAAWRALDVTVAHELILDRALGIDAAAVRTGEQVTYTRDAGAAALAVQRGEASLALLLNPTPPTQVRDVARAGDRMPQKSTYFYPKLLTGLVINPLW
ncbi:MAG TPA: DUF1015 domain-containing protein [Ktedonobacterales bacterium]|nr:DUF1015 domain-containing protein [Ktedonobacterales bacterium]